MFATFKLAEVPLCALTDPKADLLLADFMLIAMSFAQSTEQNNT
jgi:hypothetical protein